MGKFSVKELMNNAVPISEELQEAAASARSIEQITAEINFYKAQTVQNIIEIGRRLTEAKAQLPHGEWGGWLKTAVDFSERSAQNFMRIAEQYPNPQALADLSYTKMVALLQVPADERDDFVAQAHVVNGTEKTVADMSSRELEQAIKERDAARLRAMNAAEQERKYKRESDTNYKKYMTALAEKENAVQAARNSYDSLALDKRLLQNKLAAAERQGSTAAPNAEAERLRRELEALKRQSVATTATLDPTITADAAESFRDAIDAAYAQFESIIKCSEPAAAVRCMPRCVSAMRDLYEEINKLEAAARNLMLMDRDEELPAEFYEE